jgi:hypothetical protein
MNFSTYFFARYVKEGEPKSRPGYNKGLTLILDAHSNKISSGSVSDDFRGFMTAVDSGDKFPLTDQKGFLIRPGHQNYVVLDAVQVKADHAIKSIREEKRLCYFADEHPLKMHTNYSQSSCILECNVEYARKTIEKFDNITGGCVPWFYPVVDEYVHNLCDPWQITRFQDAMKSIPDSHCDYCHPDCDTTIYDSSISAAPFRPCDHTNLGVSQICNLINTDMNPPIWASDVETEYDELNPEGIPEYIKPTPLRMNNMRRYSPLEKIGTLALGYKNNKDRFYDAFQKDIAVVSFYFNKQTVVQYQKSLSMTWVGFLAKVFLP